jgi:tetratricopeptide (TPR) repeat protein
MHLKALAAVCVLGLVSAAGWFGWNHVDGGRYRSEVEAAKRRLVAGDVLGARERLASASSRWPGRGEAEILLGACEQALGRDDAAEAAWSRVKAGTPSAADASMFRARLALSRHRMADAERLLPAALSANGRLGIEARESLLLLLKLQGRYDEARRLVRDGWDHYPDRVGTLQQLWRLDTDTALSPEQHQRVVEQAARAAPDDDRVWLAQAALELRRNRHDEAARWLEKCLDRRPGDPVVWRAWLDWALSSQDVARARQALPHLGAEPFEASEVLALGAWFAARAGAPERERRALAELVRQAPSSIRAIERLAALVQQAGRHEEASRLRAQKSQLDEVMNHYAERLFKPDPAKDAPDLARWAEALGRHFEAKCWWSIAVRRKPADPEPAANVERLARDDANRPRQPTIAMLVSELDSYPLDSPVSSHRQTASTTVVPKFRDDAEASGLRFTYDNGVTPGRQIPETMGGGVGLLDYDADGWLDVYCIQGGTLRAGPAQPPNADRLFRNRGDGTFEDASDSSGISALPGGYGHGVTVGDYDNDGDADLFLTRFGSYALFRNRGDGTFEDATESAGLGGDRDWPTSAAFADLDNDGDLDLYVCHYLAWDVNSPQYCASPDHKRNLYCNPGLLPSLPDHLFRNDGGRLVDVSAEAGIVDLHGRGLGVVACDFDADGLLDLYVANDQTANFLFRNLGGMRFQEDGHGAGVAASGGGGYQAGMGIACGDFSGDGLPDVAVTNFYSEGTTYYQNLGGAIFSDMTDSIGLGLPSRHLLGFGAAFFDADNDGWLDLATANGHVDDFRPDDPYAMPVQLLLGQGRRLRDVTRDAGPPFSLLRLGRGLAVGDLDNDGRLDLLIQSLDGPLAYFHNQTQSTRGLTLRLEGTASNRDAVGARVTIHTTGRRQVAWRLGGGSYQSASDARIHFGLGDSERVESVELAWPSGRVDRYPNWPPGPAYRLREGSAEPIHE